MKIDKAIEILIGVAKGDYTVNRYDFTDAIRLGIEALKRVQTSRVQRLADFIEPLPGETKD